VNDNLFLVQPEVSETMSQEYRKRSGEVMAVVRKNSIQAKVPRNSAELSPRTFCTFLREFSPFKGYGLLTGSDSDPRHVQRVYSFDVRSPVAPW
jgi:hypothetical protein